MERFRGGLVLKAHRLLYHSTLGSRVIKKKKTGPEANPVQIQPGFVWRSWGGVCPVVKLRLTSEIKRESTLGIEPKAS